jgi:hypothetical protein
MHVLWFYMQLLSRRRKGQPGMAIGHVLGRGQYQFLSSKSMYVIR